MGEREEINRKKEKKEETENGIESLWYNSRSCLRDLRQEFNLFLTKYKPIQNDFFINNTVMWHYAKVIMAYNKEIQKIKAKKAK
jgi:hypothetical protein